MNIFLKLKSFTTIITVQPNIYFNTFLQLFSYIIMNINEFSYINLFMGFILNDNQICLRLKNMEREDDKAFACGVKLS